MLIKTNNLYKYYGDGDFQTKALDGINLEIQKGEFVAIMGPSGSGKSTLLHMLGFLDKQTGGEYFFDERKITDYTSDQLAHIRNKKMGFIFQSFNLLSKTSVLDNVKLPLIYSDIPEDQWDTMALRVIKRVKMDHRASHTPGQLSGGEQQRVSISRALILNPDIIFADEPTGNLDSKSGQIIMQTLQELNREGQTIVLITHEKSTAMHAKRIIHVLDGKIVDDEKVLNPLGAKVSYTK